MHLKALATLTFATAILAWTSSAQAAPTNICFTNDAFAVSATTDDFTNQVFSVVRKKSADEGIPCPISRENADFVVGSDNSGQTYTDLVGDHLVFTVYNGRMTNLHVIDLKTNQTVLDVSGFYEQANAEVISYWERGKADTRATCNDDAEITADGVNTGKLYQKELSLTTFKSTATGNTGCEGS